MSSTLLSDITESTVVSSVKVSELLENPETAAAPPTAVAPRAVADMSLSISELVSLSLSLTSACNFVS